ncbi:ABC transporter permease [Nitratireductor basaltis]|uniref:Transport permease protein n=1 Tax=Nitratireductor basaltis TaxID=472175 RepID=A0A084UD01_9HYPH|nr:ABC transporter permease [Nitratireductor basaltis]KFB10837.1 ABC-type polysaccharide/polyol phosphate export system, permease component [Nitratireductor basaltis]
MLSALWSYRHFVRSSIAAELRARYARSRIGLFWSILHPLAQAAIFALVLAQVLGAKLNGIDDKAAYPMYLLSGMAAWSLFSEILTRCLNVFIEYAGTLKKISFPRLSLPLIVWGSALLNHFFLLLAIFVVFLFFGKFPSFPWIALPLGIILISLFAFGLGMLLGVLNVFSRDVGQVVTVVMQLWFWITPIVYPIDIVPEHLLIILKLNPLVPIVEIYQDAMVYGDFPNLYSLIYPAALSLSLFSLSFIVFRKASSELVDVL